MLYLNVTVIIRERALGIFPVKDAAIVRERTYSGKGSVRMWIMWFPSQ